MQVELNAYQAKVNLTLLNDITAFVLDTAEATHTQRAALFQRCPLLYSQDGKFQEKYGFLYLGELLERYEERFGMNVPDLRAIALALGYTRDFTTAERYQTLTGETYTDIFWKTSYSNRFGLLVSKGILDLWDLFRNSLDESGGIAKPEMLSNIKRYLRNISTARAYQFYDKFFTVYGAAGLERYFGYEHRDFFDAVTTRQSYGNGPLRLKIKRDFLDTDGHRQLLHWLEEYVFFYKPEEYLLLIATILQDEFAVGLFTPEEQRKLFDLAARRPDISTYDLNALKRRFLTEAELQAEQDARSAALRASEEQRQAVLVQGIRDRYAEMSSDFASIIKFLAEYKYHRDERPIACRVICENLDKLLESRNCELDGQEAVRFLYVCNKLVKENVLRFAEAQAYITKVKEC